jgi:hypothetical protein
MVARARIARSEVDADVVAAAARVREPEVGVTGLDVRGVDLRAADVAEPRVVAAARRNDVARERTSLDHHEQSQRRNGGGANHRAIVRRNDRASNPDHAMRVTSSNAE